MYGNEWERKKKGGKTYPQKGDSMFKSYFSSTYDK